MKFRRGAWLWESGVTPHCMKRVVEHRVDGDSLLVCGVSRGDGHTGGGPTIDPAPALAVAAQPERAVARAGAGERAVLVAG